MRQEAARKRLENANFDKDVVALVEAQRQPKSSSRVINEINETMELMMMEMMSFTNFRARLTKLMHEQMREF